MKIFNINDILDLLSDAVTYNLIATNEMFYRKVRLSEKEQNERKIYLDKVKKLVTALNGSTDEIQILKSLDETKLLSKNLVNGSIGKKIDPDRFVTLALFYVIKSIDDNRREIKNELKELKKSGNVNLEEIKFSRTAEELREYLTGKDIKIACNVDDRIVLISSINLCAMELRDLDDNIIGNEKAQKERQLIKEKHDKRTEQTKKDNIEKINQIDEELYNKILKKILLSDFIYICNSNASEWLLNLLYEKLISMNIIKSKENLFKDSKWWEIHNSENYVEVIKEFIKENLGYIDFDKLLIDSAFRYLQSTCDTQRFDENEETSKILLENKQIIERILDYLKDKSNVKIRLTYDPLHSKEDIEYKLKDLKSDVKKLLPSGIYVSTQLIQRTKEEILNGERKLADIDKDLLKYMDLSEDTIKKYAIISEENFQYILKNYDLTNEKIKEIIYDLSHISPLMIDRLLDNKKIERKDLIELFKKGKIDTKCIHGKIESDEVVDLFQSGAITYENLVELFSNGDIDADSMGILIAGESEDKVLDSLDTGKLSIMKIKEISENGSMENLDSNYIYEMYISDDEHKFKSLNPLFWGFQNGKLSIRQLNELYTKYGIVKEEDLYKAALNNYFSKEKISELYLESFLSDDELDKLIENKIIDEKFARILKNKLKLDIIEKSFPFNGKIATVNLNDLKLPESKIQPNNNGNGRGGRSVTGKGIDPKFKLDVIANLQVPISKISDESFKYEKDNPFYDYEFFVIKEKDGSINEDSLVIAEKFYKSRNKKGAWAYGDATYIFKMKDLKRVGKKSKKEIGEFVKGNIDTENSVDVYQGIERVLHKTKETWAINLTKKIAKMLGQNKTSIYSKEELESIKNSSLYINEIYDLEK